jgi:hypothetical protein
MTVGEIKTKTLHEMREYASGGEAISDTDNKDYLLSVVPLINLFQNEIATQQNAIYATYPIAQNNPENQLGTSWYEGLVHSSEDISYSATGSQAYSFQVCGTATVYIEEETAEDTWTTLDTISHTDSTGYTTYKDIITASDIENDIRIRFSGSYRYQYRYVALFAEAFPDDDSVPPYLPAVPYDLPTTFFRLDRVDWTHQNGIMENYAAYRFETYGKSSKRIYLPYSTSGEVNVHYYAYPTFITEPSASDLTTQDDTVLDLPDEYEPTLVHRISAALLRDEEPYLADTFNNEYFVGMNAHIGNRPQDNGIETPINTSNW